MTSSKSFFHPKIKALADSKAQSELIFGSVLRKALKDEVLQAIFMVTEGPTPHRHLHHHLVCCPSFLCANLSPLSSPRVAGAGLQKLVHY